MPKTLARFITEGDWEKTCEVDLVVDLVVRSLPESEGSSFPKVVAFYESPSPEALRVAFSSLEIPKTLSATKRVFLRREIRDPKLGEVMGTEFVYVESGKDVEPKPHVCARSIQLEESTRRLRRAAERALRFIYENQTMLEIAQLGEAIGSRERMAEVTLRASEVSGVVRELRLALGNLGPVTERR